MNLYIFAGDYAQATEWCKKCLPTRSINPRYVDRVEDVLGISKKSYFVYVGTFGNRPDYSDIHSMIKNMQLIEVDWHQPYWIDALINGVH